MSPFTVIIPAHNEEAVIGRCLLKVMQDAPADCGMEIIVAANGCIDRTAQIARETAADVMVLELARGSKTAAINAALEGAGASPCIVLDADVICSFWTMRALADALNEEGVMTASPAIRLDLEDADSFVRAYYRTWMRQPYAKAGSGGAGCYGLSQAALNQIGEFPDILGDDVWIHTRFAQAQKRYVEQDKDGRPVFTIVRPPQTLREQVHVEARRQRGNKQVQANYPSPHNLRSGGSEGLKGAAQNASSLFDLASFVGIKLLARMLASWQSLTGRSETWARAQSSRQA